MIFDSLAHITHNGKWFHTEIDASASRLENELKKNKVSGAIISGTPNENDFCLNYIKTQKNKHLIFAPALMSQDIDKLDIFTEKYASRLIKLHPRWLNTDVENKIFQDVLSYCQDNQIIVLLCTVFDRSISQNPTYSLAKISKNFPDLKIIFVHGGNTDILSVAESIRGNQNIILDLSYTLSRFYDSSIGLDINYLIRNFDKRICIGTDFPEHTYSDVYKALKFLNQDLCALEDKGILGKNLLQFIEIE